jgi:uncharacterized protein YjiS (DUF1127 family)
MNGGAVGIPRHMLVVGPREACRIGEVGHHVPATGEIRPRRRRLALENGGMELLRRVASELSVRRKQAGIRNALGRLNDRALADLGLERREIADVARIGARLGPDGARLSEVAALVRAARPRTLADRIFGSLERLSERKAAELAFQPQDLDRYRQEALRLRAATLDGIAREVGRSIAALVRTATESFRTSELGRRIQLRLVWWRAYRQMRGELATYSDRELMTDLRLARSQIGEVAAEGADERVADFVAANPGFRRAWAARTLLRHAHG